MVRRALEGAECISLVQLEEISEVMLVSCLKVFPFHAAASLNALTERILGAVIAGYGADWDAALPEMRKTRMARVAEILEAGAIFR